MATLHILSHSPFTDSRFRSCLRLLAPGDGLLLTGEAVQAARAGAVTRQSLEALPEGIDLYALDEDLGARAIDEIPPRLERVDYPRFVELCTQYQRTNSWL